MIKVLLLPEMSRDERARENVNFEQIPCSTRAAVRHRCGESCPSLHWKGFLFIARES